MRRSCRQAFWFISRRESFCSSSAPPRQHRLWLPRVSCASATARRLPGSPTTRDSCPSRIVTGKWLKAFANQKGRKISPSTSSTAGDSTWNVVAKRSPWFRLGHEKPSVEVRHFSHEEQSASNGWHFFFAHGHLCSCCRSLRSPGRPDEQVHREWHGHLPTGALSSDPPPEGPHPRGAQRRREEAGGGGLRAGGCPERDGPGANRRIEPLQLRWAPVLLPDAIVRGSQVLPRELSRHEDGRRQERRSL